MALNFPSNPVNGQVYQGFVFDTSRGTWKKLASYPTMPTGAILAWSTTTAPAGYLVCDGSAVSRSTYASLYSVIGTTYGAGDGSTTFNLPDLRGRVATGRDATQTEFDTLGEQGGSKTQTIAKNQLPQEAVTDAGTSATDTSFALKFTGSAGYGAKSLNQQAITTQPLSVTQPYTVVTYIIKWTMGVADGTEDALTARVTVAETRVTNLELAKSNLLHNSAFLINQRGQSTGTVYPDQYVFDRWAGGHASANVLDANSAQFDNTVGIWAATGATLARSTDWAESGTVSLKITPSSTTSFAQSTNLIGAGVVAGTIYGVSASYWTSNGHDSTTANGSVRRLEVYYRTGTGSYTSLLSNAAPNTAGRYRLALTVAIPSGTTELYMRLWNGSATVPVYYDDVRIEAVVGNVFRSGTTPDAPLSVSSGTMIRQTVEAADVPPGQYTLSWEGDVVARMYYLGAAPGASSGTVVNTGFASSPITIGVNGTKPLVVEFAAIGADRSFNHPALRRGAGALPWSSLAYADEMQRCQRYYQVFDNNRLVFGQYFNDATCRLTTQFRVTMRVPPISVFSNYIVDRIGIGTQTGTGWSAGPMVSNDSMSGDMTGFTSSGTFRQAVYSGRAEFNADF